MAEMLVMSNEFAEIAGTANAPKWIAVKYANRKTENMLSGTYTASRGKNCMATHTHTHTPGPTMSASKKIERKRKKKFNGNGKLWTVFKNFIYDNDNRMISNSLRRPRSVSLTSLDIRPMTFRNWY